MKRSESIFWKIVASLFVMGVVFASFLGLMKMGVGNWFLHTSFINIVFLFLAIVVSGYLVCKGLYKIWTLIALVAILQGCNYAKSNQQVVVSTDCGMTWERINAGDAVPRSGVNMCYMKVVMPNFPMQGDSRFISNLKDRVRAFVHIDYDYSIIDPLAFIKQAKYLGKANSDADSGDALDAGAFEGAENMVIDKRIRDVSKSMLLNEDIVELDQAELENNLLEKSNEVLKNYGIQLNFITLTFELDEQTRQAIDISTAMKIYESKKLSDLGKEVMAARAGATKIVIETPANPKTGE